MGSSACSHGIPTRAQPGRRPTPRLMPSETRVKIRKKTKRRRPKPPPLRATTKGSSPGKTGPPAVATPELGPKPGQEYPGCGKPSGDERLPRRGRKPPLAATLAQSPRNCLPIGQTYGEKAVVEQGLDAGFEGA